MPPRRLFEALVATLLLLVLSRSAEAESDFSKLYRAREDIAVAEVTRESPEAGAALREGLTSDNEGAFTSAKASYEKAHELAPKSPHPLRFLCDLEVRQGESQAAIGHCEQAVALSRDAATLSALSLALQSSNPQRALDLASAASEMAPTDQPAALGWAQAALANKNRDAFSKAVHRLQSIAPENGTTYYYTAILETELGRTDQAVRALEKARGAGVPDDVLADLRKQIDKHSDTLPDSWWMYPFIAAGAWVGVLVLLFGVGVILRTLVDRSTDRLPPDATGHATGTDALVKRAYARTLFVACLFYYVTLALVVLTSGALAVGSAYLYGFVGGPGRLEAFFFLLSVGTIVALVRALPRRGSDSPPGERVDLDANPRLRATLLEVAERIETRPIDAVFIEPGMEIAVFEAGSLLENVRGKTTERCLVIGLGAIQGMTLLQLKAILAHEYGHFRNEDTAGGALAATVEHSAGRVTVSMVRHGASRLLNPAWLIISGFFATFSFLAASASRLRELLADRWAAFAYGGEAFGGAMAHTCRQGVVLPLQLDRLVVSRSGKDSPPIENVYREVVPITSDDDLAQKLRLARSRRASAHDSHPPPDVRIASVKSLRARHPVDAADEEADAMSLFADAEALERRMSAILLSRLVRLAPALKARRERAERRAKPRMRPTRKRASVSGASDPVEGS